MPASPAETSPFHAPCMCITCQTTAQQQPRMPIHCPAPALHTVEGAPIQALANLLRTATEFVEMVDSSSAYTDADVALFDALRAAVHALNEPLAADAHAAPATGGAA